MQIVVYAVESTNPNSTKNKLFDKNLHGDLVEISPFVYERCLAAGIQFLTPDLFFAIPESERPKKVVCLMDGAVNDHADKLVAAGIRLALLMVVETPIYLSRLFYNLEKESARFDYVLMPKGAAPHVSKKTKFIPYVPSQAFTGKEKIQVKFEGKKYLALISGNKRMHFFKRWYVHFWNIFKPYPSFVDRELYHDRLEALRYFADNSEIDLYGRGWDKPVRYGNAKYQAAIKKSYRGEVERKVPVLENYKFSVCFENSIFEGYVTEKIIDSFFAGCVPIYWGAPDITDYIPANCFIDFRKFKNYAELDIFLKNMTEKTYYEYIANIQAYAASEQYQRYFGKEKFADDLIAILKSYA